MEFKALERIGFDRLLSVLGQNVYLPQGIFYWVGKAKKDGKPGLNGTIGSAFVSHDEMYGSGDDTFGIAHIPDAAGCFPDVPPAKAFAYAPINGTPEFREAWAKWQLYKAGKEYADVEGHLTKPIVVPGITGGIFYAVRLFLNPGEKLVCPIQRWENYDTIISQNLGVGFAEYPHFEGEEFNVEGFVNAVDSVLQDSPRAVALLNFPNNPTGYNPTAKLVRERLLPAVTDLVQRHDKPLVVLFDDAYEGYAYDEESMRVSPFYEFVNVDDRIVPVKMDGMSKEMLWYGGRIACITFGVCDEWLNEASIEELSKDLDNKIGGMIRGSISNSPHIVQTVATKLLEDPDNLVQQRKPTVDALRRRWQALQKAMKNLPPNIKPDPYQGGFFLFLNIEGVPAIQVAEHLLANHGVTLVPTEKPEKGQNGLRLAYCGIDEKNIPVVIDAVAKSVEAVGAGA